MERPRGMLGALFLEQQSLRLAHTHHLAGVAAGTFFKA